MTFRDTSEAAQALADPQLSATDLANIAYQFPELRSSAAMHAKAYSGLLDWLDKLGDPNISGVVAARRARVIVQPVDVHIIPAFADATGGSYDATRSHASLPMMPAPVRASPPGAVREAITPESINPGPIAVLAGKSRDPYVYAMADSTGAPVWDLYDGEFRNQWQLRSYEATTRVVGANEFAAEPAAFPASRYSSSSHQGMLFATASRLIVWFPVGQNGYAMGTAQADGYVRLGQVRYEWINEIGFTNPAGVFNISRVLVAFAEPSGAAHRLAMILGQHEPTASSSIAAFLRQSVLNYRITMTGPAKMIIEVITAAQSGFMVTDQAGVFSWHCPGLVAGDGEQYRPFIG